MAKKQELISQQFLKHHQDEILRTWQDELEKNIPADQHDGDKALYLCNETPAFLNQIMDLMDKETIPNFSLKAFEPVLKLWHSLFKSQQQKGLSIKDMAMLIFSLKSTILNIATQEQAQKDFDYKPDLDELRYLLDFLGLMTFELYSVENEKIITRQNEQIKYLQDQRLQKHLDGLIGQSPAIQTVYKAISLVLDNAVTVLLEGESGVGKDVIANLIHKSSKRKTKPLIAVNCGAIPKELIESELFGHERGAFTGAETRRVGKFELAQGGTLFLDEIGELPLDMQVKLLRAIQNKEIERVGGKEKIKIDIRIIAATNRSLKKLVDNKTFRLDLYYRLHVFPIQIPALRERKEDILPLAQHFAKHYAEQFELPEPDFTESAVNFLLNQHWEGNIRELENVIQRSVLVAQGQPITVDILDTLPGQSPIVLDDHALLPSPQQPSIVPLDDLEKQAILNALSVTNGNIVQAAKALGISRTTLYNKLDKYGIEP